MRTCLQPLCTSESITKPNLHFLEYYLPNDERENGLCPKINEGAKRVLDAGTGTGIWAIEYGTRPVPTKISG